MASMKFVISNSVMSTPSSPPAMVAWFTA
jgi:hypothetical protein